MKGKTMKTKFADDMKVATAVQRGALYDRALKKLAPTFENIQAIEEGLSVDVAMAEGFPLEEQFRVNQLKGRKALEILAEEPFRKILARVCKRVSQDWSAPARGVTLEEWAEFALDYETERGEAYEKAHGHLVACVKAIREADEDAAVASLSAAEAVLR
jgi:hypothetical protein